MQKAKNKPSKQSVKPTDEERNAALEGLHSLTDGIKEEIYKNQVPDDLELSILAAKFARLHLNLESCKASFTYLFIIWCR